MSTYKESFHYETKLRNNFTWKEKLITFCLYLVRFILLICFAFCLTDLPNSEILVKLMRGEEILVENSLMGKTGLSYYIRFVKRVMLILVSLMSEPRVNLYSKISLVAVIVHTLLNQYKARAKTHFEIMMRQIRSDKDVFVTRFFDLIGSDFTQSLERFIILKHKLQKKNSDDLEKKLNLASEKRDKIKKQLEKEKKTARMYGRFTQGIMGFQWCTVCFDEEVFEGAKKTLNGEIQKNINFKAGYREQQMVEACNSGDKKTDALLKRDKKVDVDLPGDKFENAGNQLKANNGSCNEKLEASGSGMKEKLSGNKENSTAENNQNCDNSKSTSKEGLEKSENKSDSFEANRAKEFKDLQIMARKVSQSIANDVEDCQDNCLIMFLLLCDQLGTQMKNEHDI